MNIKSFMKQFFVQRIVYFTIGMAEALKDGRTNAESIAYLLRGFGSSNGTYMQSVYRIIKKRSALHSA